MTPRDARIHEKAAIGFQLAAEAYQRGRPSYPSSAVDFLARVLNLTSGRRVIELGAGTGKLTTRLLTTGAEVLAVEPVAAMRDQLAQMLPGVKVVDGTAESIPASDSTADAVVAAQAFHWFHGQEALGEIHRVLKPSGGLGLIWNVRDESSDWVRELTRIMVPHEGSTPRYKSLQWMEAFRETPLFSSLEQQEFPYVEALSLDAVLDRVASISFIAALPASDRNAVLTQVANAVRNDPQVRELERVDVPYRTHVYWCRKR